MHVNILTHMFDAHRPLRARNPSLVLMYTSVFLRHHRHRIQFEKKHISITLLEVDHFFGHYSSYISTELDIEAWRDSQF